MSHDSKAVRGEKEFTPRVRGMALRAYDAEIRRIERNAERLRVDRFAIAAASTTEELALVDKRTYSNDPFPSLWLYAQDFRSTCCVCKKKVHGGVGWAPGFFFCEKSRCDSMGDKLYALAKGKQVPLQPGDKIRGIKVRHAFPLFERKKRKALLKAAKSIGLEPTGDKHVY